MIKVMNNSTVVMWHIGCLLIAHLPPVIEQVRPSEMPSVAVCSFHLPKAEAELCKRSCCHSDCCRQIHYVTQVRNLQSVQYYMTAAAAKAAAEYTRHWPLSTSGGRIQSRPLMEHTLLPWDINISLIYYRGPVKRAMRVWVCCHIFRHWRLCYVQVNYHVMWGLGNEFYSL